MNLDEDFVFDSNLTDHANVIFGEILTGDAGHVTIRGSNNDFVQGGSHAYSSSNTVPKHLLIL